MKSWVFSSIFTFTNILLKVKNFNKPKLLIYTDSRGFDVIGKKGKNPINSYVQYLAFRYRVTYKICPEKYTTIVDFLDYINSINLDKYDYLIMHCGIVDFSPRPLSNIDSVKQSKKGQRSFDILFKKNIDYHQNYLGPKYNNEDITTLYSKDYFVREIIPKLKRLNSFLWINSNHFVPGWEGNYTKGRPVNIDETVNSYSMLLASELKNIVDLKSWNNDDIKSYTIDNIHFTKEGFKKVYYLIDEKLKNLASN